MASHEENKQPLSEYIDDYAFACLKAKHPNVWGFGFDDGRLVNDKDRISQEDVNTALWFLAGQIPTKQAGNCYLSSAGIVEVARRYALKALRRPMLISNGALILAARHRSIPVQRCGRSPNAMIGLKNTVLRKTAAYVEWRP